jgi:hypothetical protein
MKKHKLQDKDLELQKSDVEVVEDGSQEEPTWFWHVEQTLKFATIASAALTAYQFANYAFSFVAENNPPRKAEMVKVLATATKGMERRAGPPPTCPNTNLTGQQEYTGAGYQQTPVATSGGGIADVAFLNTPGAIARVSMGAVSLNNPVLNSDVLPYTMDQLSFGKNNPGVAIVGNQTFMVWDNGYYAYRQTLANAANGVQENFISYYGNAGGNSYRPSISTSGSEVFSSFTTQECTAGTTNTLQVARQKFFPNNTAASKDACVSTSYNNINDYSRVAASQNITMYAWTSQVNSSATKSIWFRDENATGFGQLAEVEMTLPQYFPHHDCILQQIVWLNDGNRAGLFTAKDKTNPSLGYVPYIQLINANGTLTGAPIQIPSVMQNYYYERIGMTVVSDGFVVAGGNDASSSAVIYLQKYNNLGQPQGSQINLPNIGSYSPTITTLPGDCLLVAYQDNNNHVATQILCPNINLQSTAQNIVSYIENGNAINLPPFYIPQVYTYTPGAIIINITFPSNVGTISAGGQTSSNGVLQITAANFAQANQILNCITYTQATDFSGSFDVSVTVNDGISPAASVTLPIIGNPINVAAVVNTASFVIPQGATVTITQAMLNITDVDTPPQNITIFISNPNNGYFQRNVNGTVTPNILQFTYDEVLAGEIQIVAQGSAAIGFQMQVGDTRSGLPSNLGAVFIPYINFIPNQPESLLENQNIAIAQGQSTLITNATLLAASNKDPSLILFNIATIAHATIERFDTASNTWAQVTTFTQQDINNHWIRATADNSGQVPVVVFTYGDSLWTAPLQALTFNYNAAPVIQIATIPVNSNQAVQINQNYIEATDSTASVSQLIFSVPQNTQLNGHFAYGNQQNIAIYQFSQAEINTGNIYFVPNKDFVGQQNVQVTLSVTDGELTTQKQLSIDFNVKKISPVANARQVIQNNPEIGVILGLMFTGTGYLARRGIQEHRRDRISTFAARVRNKLNLDMPSFKEVDGAAFVNFIDELVKIVDEQLPGVKFNIGDARLKHNWTYLERRAQRQLHNKAENYLDEVATIFAHELAQHAEITPAPWWLPMPNWAYTKVNGYTFKQQSAKEDVSLAGKIVTLLNANKQKIASSVSQRILKLVKQKTGLGAHADLGSINSSALKGSGEVTMQEFKM